jgi:hypothetical protein
MKILLYHHRTASKDGQAVHIEELTTALRQLGHEVIVVGPAATVRQSFGGQDQLIRRLKRLLPKIAYEILEFSYSIVASSSRIRSWPIDGSSRPTAGTVPTSSTSGPASSCRPGCG